MGLNSSQTRPDKKPLLGLRSRPEIPVLSGPFYPAPMKLTMFFHQCFTRIFFVQIFSTKMSNPKHSFVIFGAKVLYKKLNIDEIHSLS